MENVEEHRQTQRGENANERGDHRRRGNDTVQKTRHAHNTTNRQQDRQQNHPDQRQERRIFESHGGSMALPLRSASAG